MFLRIGLVALQRNIQLLELTFTLLSASPQCEKRFTVWPERLFKITIKLHYSCCNCMFSSRIVLTHIHNLRFCPPSSSHGVDPSKPDCFWPAWYCVAPNLQNCRLSCLLYSLVNSQHACTETPLILNNAKFSAFVKRYLYRPLVIHKALNAFTHSKFAWELLGFLRTPRIFATHGQNFSMTQVMLKWWEERAEAIYEP